MIKFALGVWIGFVIAGLCNAAKDEVDYTLIEVGNGKNYEVVHYD